MTQQFPLFLAAAALKGQQQAAPSGSSYASMGLGLAALPQVQQHPLAAQQAFMEWILRGQKAGAEQRAALESPRASHLQLDAVSLAAELNASSAACSDHIVPEERAGSPVTPLEAGRSPVWATTPWDAEAVQPSTLQPATPEPPATLHKRNLQVYETMPIQPRWVLRRSSLIAPCLTPTPTRHLRWTRGESLVEPASLQPTWIKHHPAFNSALIGPFPLALGASLFVPIGRTFHC